MNAVHYYSHVMLGKYSAIVNIYLKSFSKYSVCAPEFTKLSGKMTNGLVFKYHTVFAKEGRETLGPYAPVMAASRMTCLGTFCCHQITSGFQSVDVSADTARVSAFLSRLRQQNHM